MAAAMPRRPAPGLDRLTGLACAHWAPRFKRRNDLPPLYQNAARTDAVTVSCASESGPHIARRLRLDRSIKASV
jgi:hypothetical protein